MIPEEIFGLCNRKNAIFVILCAAAICVHLFGKEEVGAEGQKSYSNVEELRESWCLEDEELSVFRSHCNDVENIVSAFVDAFHVRFPSR